jgi:hypothetical protein
MVKIAEVPSVTAKLMVKKMTGGAQAHLIKASDLKHYVVKFINNPQHRRILSNEFLSSLLLNHLGLPTPPVALVRVEADFIRENSAVYIEGLDGRVPPSVGQHFGGAYPGSPLTDVVYDFVPDVILRGVANIEAFLGILVFDKWIGNTDSRQCLFFRAGTGPGSFVVQFIDNGQAFDGHRWRFVDATIRGPYFRPVVYGEVRQWADFEPWIERIKSFPEDVIKSAIEQLPTAWLDKDENELHRLFEQLLKRRAIVPALLAETIRNCPASFANWRT